LSDSLLSARITVLLARKTELILAELADIKASQADAIERAGIAELRTELLGELTAWSIATMNRERQQLKQTQEELKQTQEQLATANQQLAEVARDQEELAQLKKQARRSDGRTASWAAVDRAWKSERAAATYRRQSLS
jgi:hypothetical protein